MAPKIILTRPLPAEKGLEGGALLDQAERAGLVRVVRWTKDEPVDRKWLLEELGKGDTDGLLCMHNGEKVRPASCGSRSRLLGVALEIGWDESCSTSAKACMLRMRPYIRGVGSNSADSLLRRADR